MDLRRQTGKGNVPGVGVGQDRGEGKARGAPDEESVSQHIFDCKKHTRIYVLSYASIFNITLIIHFVFVEIKFTEHKIHLYKGDISMAFSIFTMLCNHHHYFQEVSSPQKETPHLLVIPNPPHPHLLAITNLLSVSIHLSLLDTSYKWNHTTYGLLCLASFT